MLPMGTIMTVCMLIGVLAGLLETVRRISTPASAAESGSGTSPGNPPTAIRVAGGIVLLAGIWNTFWYALRHLGEHWGQMALGSGLLMLVIGACLLLPVRLPGFMRQLLPVASIVLAGFAWHYGNTIYHL